MVTIEITSPDREDVAELLDRSDALMASLYPAESNHMDSVEELSKPNTLFLGAFLSGRLVGCGAVKILENDGRYGEIKRVFVETTARGKGVAVRLMERLEIFLLESDVSLARLETGFKSVEAFGLYRKLGYREREPFGEYRPDPQSVFMEKSLTE